MKILIDTHIFLWFITGDCALSNDKKQLIKAADQVFVSMVSLWECAIKISLKKLDFDLETLFNAIKASDFEILHMQFRHLLEVERLPFLHRDPFDRMLIAQAKSEPLILVTDDQHIQGYF